MEIIQNEKINITAKKTPQIKISKKVNVIKSMKLDQTFKDYIIENNNLTIEKQKEDKLKDLIPESKEAFTYESIPKVEIKEKSETEGK